MRVVLGKAAHPHDAVQRARGFIAVAGSEFGHAQGQVAVAFQALVVDLHMSGAVHGLERIDAFLAGMFLVHFDDEHVFLVFFPMARGLPQLAVHHLRGVHLDIAAAGLHPAHVILQRGIDTPAIGVPEYLAGGLFLHVKQVHLAAQFAVVALGCLFQHGQMFLEFLAVAEGHAIDALQHGAVAVAAPVRPGHAHQFEGVRRHLAGILQMRAAAQILPVAMPIHANGLIFGDHADQFDLVGLVVVLIEPYRPGAIPQLGPDRIALVDDLAHLRFDRTQILGREGLFAVEIIVKTVLDHRADGYLDVGPQFLHRARHDVGGVMADEFQRRFLVLHGVDGDAGICVDWPLQVPMLAVDGGADCLLAQGIGDIGGDLGRRHASGIFTRITIREGQGDLGHGPVPRRFGAHDAPGCGFRFAPFCRMPRPGSSPAGAGPRQ